MTAAPLDVTAEDLPLLGEPLAVELANSLYVGEDETVDFLATPGLVSLWLRSAANAGDVHIPTRISLAHVAELHTLRAAVRTVLLALSNGHQVDPDAVRTINRFAAAAPSYARLETDGQGQWRTVTQASVATAEGLLGRLAHETVVLVGTSPGPLVRRCEAPGCPMLFVKDHHRRRWCHESCGHRNRQNAYVRRRSLRGAPEKT